MTRFRYGTKVSMGKRTGTVTGIASVGCYLQVKWDDGTVQGEILPGQLEAVKPQPSPLARLLDDARAAGYTVEETERGGWSVYRERMVNQYRRRREGIWIYPDGTACLLGMDLDTCMMISRPDEMRKALGINKA